MPGGFDTVLVVDFGAQYAQLIARRVRECHVYSEIVPATMPAEQMLARQPKAIILSGGPSSVYAPGAPPAPPGLLDAGVPVLGICYGFQLMVAGLGGTVERTGAAEYGATELETGPSHLLAGSPRKQQVWMSHGDTAHGGPAGFPGDRADRRDAGGGDREPRARPVRRPVPSRGGAHRVRHPRPGPLPGAGRVPPVLDHAEHRRGPGSRDPRADRRRPGHLRAVRRGGLRGRRRTRAACHW